MRNARIHLVIAITNVIGLRYPVGFTMPKQNENNITLAPRPLEIKLADVLFFAIRKHLMIFKDLTGSRYVHYTMIMKGSLIDFHKTLEDKGKHIPLARVEFDWRFLTSRVIEEIQANWKSVFHKVRKRDPGWADLEVDFIPFEVLKELLLPIAKGARWDVDVRVSGKA